MKDLTTEDTESTERATPETDSQITTFDSISKYKKRFKNKTGTVSANFARKLERERDEARVLIKETEAFADRFCQERDDAVAECKSLWSLVNANKLRAYKAERERDEAREARDIARLEAEEISQELANARKQIEGLNNFANERFEEIQKVRKERDEARKHLAAANKGAEINAHINNSLTAKLAEAKRERDEARALVDRLHVAFEGRCRATYEWYFTQGSDVREAALQFLYPEHFK